MTPVTIEYTTEKAWLDLRKQDITSTETAALFGLSPYLTAFELWHRKKTGIVPEFKSNERMAWGNRLEAAIAAGIAEEQGWTVAPKKHYMRLPNERIGSSFDFVILGHPEGNAHLEIKNVDYLQFRDGWMVDDDGFIEAPAHIEIQVQHQMMVSGFKLAYIGVLVGGNRLQVIERRRDEQAIAGMRARIAEFWRTIDANEEPAPVMPQDAEAVIRMNNYAEPGKIIDASGVAKIASLMAQYRQAKADADGAEELAKSLKAEILIEIGDAEKVLGPDYSLSCSMVADTPGKIITPDMVGQIIGARKGFRNFRITKRAAKAA